MFSWQPVPDGGRCRLRVACVYAAALLAAPLAHTQELPDTGLSPINVAAPFGQLATWQGQDADRRQPLVFGALDLAPVRAFAPPMLQREGWQPRLGVALEWVRNPSLSFDGSEPASAGLLLAGVQYALRTPTTVVNLDASLEAIETRSAELKRSTLDAATVSAFVRHQLTERSVWEYAALLQRTHEPDGASLPETSQRRFRADLQRHNLSAAMRLAPTTDLLARAEVTLQRSQDPAVVDSDSRALSLSAGWRRSHNQRLSAALRQRRIGFEGHPSVNVESLQLQWEQQWSRTWLTEVSVQAADASGLQTPLLWRVSTTHSMHTGSVSCSAESDLDALRGLNRLTWVQRARCDTEWRVGHQGRASAGLELSRYRIGDSGEYLQSLRPYLALLMPLAPTQWMRLRLSGIHDRVQGSEQRRRDLRLQITYIHNFEGTP